MSDGLIAIVGASCRFPGANGLEAFWNLLISGTDAVSEVDDSRWSTRFYFHPSRNVPGKSYTWSAGLIGDVDRFDPAFFGISPREATQMDPQQRILLQLVWHALEDAGMPPSQLAGSGAGVYIGASTTDYRDLRLGDPASGDSYSMTGGTLSIIANRVSYIYDLRGPSLTIDTACSSSLVALHHACEAIRDGRIGAAVVGGINLLLAPYPFLGFCRASMLSRKGRCFAFDERADGYVRGEGGGVVILKPLAQALADGDPIRAVIRGTGVNSDGRTIGLSLPSQAAQTALLRAVYERAEVTPDDLAFFEMHGTGTPAGDPIEAAAVGAALGPGRAAPLPIGSVKTNIGHLEPASGIAGLLKATLALEHGVVPPSLNYAAPNPNIPFENLNLRVLSAAEPIATAPTANAGVNSFGFGGTNAHAVLAAAPLQSQKQKTAEPIRADMPLLLSARSEAALREVAQQWRDTLAAAPAERASALVRAAARRREHHSHRLVALDTGDGTVAALDAYVAVQPSAAVVAGEGVREGKLAFVFAGNGAQWPGMGQRAWRDNAGFRDAVIEADRALKPALGWSVAEAIERGVEADRLVHADVAQPLLFAIQVGIVKVLRGYGIEAAAHLGHSVGEIAAAWASGALTLPQAARVAVARSRCQERTRGDGRMAALALGADSARELIAELGVPLEVGAINARQSVTVSGPAAGIETLAVEARRRGVGCRVLDLEFSFHSASMDPIREPLLASLKGLKSKRPSSALISTVTGQPIAAAEMGAEYWWQNIRTPVRFTEAMAGIVAEGCRIFVEIGPNAVLQSYLHDGLRAAEAQGRVLATLSRKEGGGDPFPAVAAQCHVAGYDLSRSAMFDGAADPRGLPLYPWQGERFWFEATAEGHNLAHPAFEHPLLGFAQPGAAPFWLNHLDPNLVPWLGDHAVENMPVLPAAAVIEMALATGRSRRPDAPALELADLELRRPLPFDRERLRELRTAVASEDGDWELSSRVRLADEAPTAHAVGRIVSAGQTASIVSFPDATAATGEMSGPELYRLAAQLGLDYGPSFQTVSRIELLGSGEAVVHLDPTPLKTGLDDYLIHPALLDGAFQGLLALLAHAQGQAQLQGVSFLPWRFGRVRLAAPFGRAPSRARLRLSRVGTRSASADVVLYDASGAVVAELSECWFRRVELNRRGSVEDRTLRVELAPAPLGEPGPPPVFERVSEILVRSALRHETRRTAGAEQSLLLEAAVAAVAMQALLSIVDAGLRFTSDELVDAERIAPETLPLFESLLQLVERYGAASRSGRHWLLATSHEVPELEEVWRVLLGDAPDLVAELALVASAPEDLARALRSGLQGGDIPNLPVLEHLLNASPASVAAIDLISGILAELTAAWPSDRPLRILEIGAGGQATRKFLDLLGQAGVPLSYVATNPDSEQAARLSFAVDDTVGATALRWSSATGDAPELEGARFDIVLGVNASVRRQLEASGLGRLRELLAPGGLLLAVEPEPNALWDLAFGRYTEWWLGGSSATGSPLRGAEEWRSELALAGFAAPMTAEVASGPWPSLAMLARAPQATAGEASEAAAAAARSVRVLSVGDFAAAAIGRELADNGWPAKVVEFAAFGAVKPGGPDAQGAAEIGVLVVDEAGDATDAAARNIELLARAAGVAAEHGLPLWVVTAGAHQRAPGRQGMVGAAVWGFARVLFNEMPRLALRLVDLPGTADRAQRARIIAAELAVESDEREIVWTEAGRHVLRVRRGLPARWADPADALSLASDQPGSLDALTWKPQAPRQLGPDEVEIDVAAAGLNFRDLMWAMGLLPEEALIDGFAGPTFGLECAGTVRQVGAAVTELSPGDRVAGFAPAALSTRVITAAHALTRIPDDMPAAAAATVPVTFVTAIYALGTLGQIAAGEHVLIHAAAGGVGLAAIQYAKYRGAVVVATAGSETKRAFLKLAGADHVLDSRDPGFADAVRAVTGGAGVDLVLNSLSGEAMEQSLTVLKPFGRFLELGKRDFYMNRRLHMRPLRQNISYFAIDVDQLPLQRPELARKLLSEISEALAEGAIRPLPYRSFSFARIDDAFRLMQASGHIGKLVLTPDGNAGIRVRELPSQPLRADGVYLVTGGLTGFGFETARWLAQQGAEAIALVGRRGSDTPEAEERVQELQALGASARIYAGDVADQHSMAAVLGRIRTEQGVLRGVVHAASAIGDALAADVDADNASPLLRPKLGGALVLDALTRDDSLELFLLFSSATTLLGAPGQGVYVAANLALESLAERRVAEGRPALAVAWGPIADAGYLAARPEVRETLARRLGAKPIPAAQALAGLGPLRGAGVPALAFAETSWNEARRFLPILATPLFADLRSDAGGTSGDDSLAERLASLGPEEVLTLLKTVVAEEAANILRLPAAGIDPLRPLSELGMDSLMAVELRLALESRMRVDLPLVSLAEGTSVSAIATRLAATVSSRSQQVSEIVSVAERYESGDADETKGVAEAIGQPAGRFHPDEAASSEAAE